MSEHAVIDNTSKDEVLLIPKYGAVLHNGKSTAKQVKLNHNDRYLEMEIIQMFS